MERHIPIRTKRYSAAAAQLHAAGKLASIESVAKGAGKSIRAFQEFLRRHPGIRTTLGLASKEEALIDRYVAAAKAVVADDRAITGYTLAERLACDHSNVYRKIQKYPAIRAAIFEATGIHVGE